MAQPLFSISSDAIQGACWQGKFGPQPSIRKAKRDKTGKYEKDENGKQIYSDFYSKRDLLHVAFVATSLYNFMANYKEDKQEDDTSTF